MLQLTFAKIYFLILQIFFLTFFLKTPDHGYGVGHSHLNELMAYVWFVVCVKGLLVPERTAIYTLLLRKYLEQNNATFSVVPVGDLYETKSFWKKEFCSAKCDLWVKCF